MSTALRGRSVPASAVVRRSSSGAFALALREVASSSGCAAAIAFALEGDEIVPHAAVGAAATLRLGADDRRTLARPLHSHRVERVDDLGFALARHRDALLVPLFDDASPIGVVCLVYDGAAPADLACGAAIELAGVALASELRRTRALSDDGDLRELSRLASLGLFLVGVAHELRGPAGALALLVPEIVRVLEGGEASGGGDDRALGRDLRRAADRMLELSRQLGGAGRRDHRQAPVDLGEVARDAVRLARLNAPEVSFAIVEPGEPVEVLGVRADLDQVAMNLLLNAIDACRATPATRHRIDVTVLAADGATLSVRDTGPGIDHAIADRIFERFFTTKPRGAGSGVGLWVSRDIAEAHGGELVLAPSGEGAAFELRLPLLARRELRALPVGAPRLVAAERREESGGATRRMGVLLVDDDPLILRTHRRALGAFEVRSAATVAEAARELAAGGVDVVVSDLGMPDGGGVALHQWMVENLADARPPMLFLTGGVTSDRQHAAVAATGCRCLTKPVPMDALAAAIRHAARPCRA